MGVDVNLYAEVEVTPERLAQADEFYRNRSNLWDYFPEDQKPALLYDDSEYVRTPRVTVNTFARYYGAHYERGPWPEIYGGIRVLQACFPEAKVFYGGDGGEDGVECTEEYVASIWDHFLSPHGNDCRAKR